MQNFPAIRLAVPTRVAAPFDDPDWLFELKHDGFRALAYIADGRCNLVSRKNNVYKSFAALCAELAGLRVKNAVMDGEIVCLDEKVAVSLTPCSVAVVNQRSMRLICCF